MSLTTEQLLLLRVSIKKDTDERKAKIANGTATKGEIITMAPEFRKSNWFKVLVNAFKEMFH